MTNQIHARCLGGPDLRRRLFRVDRLRGEGEGPAGLDTAKLEESSKNRSLKLLSSLFIPVGPTGGSRATAGARENDSEEASVGPEGDGSILRSGFSPKRNSKPGEGA